MTKSKIFICFSAIISLCMSYISTSEYFFDSPYPEYNDMKSMILAQLVHVLSRLKDLSDINLILVIIFLLNFVSLILYLFKIHIRDGIKEYFSFVCLISLIMGLAIFFSDKSTFIIYSYKEFTLKFKFIEWLPKMLEFVIPTFYLIGVQIYMMNKVKSVKLNTKLAIIRIYIVFLIFLTVTTYFRVLHVLDKWLVNLKLITVKVIFGEHPYDVADANIKYYIYYVLALTVFFGTIYGVLELYSRRKNKKKQIV